MGIARLMGIIILTVVMMISGCGLKGPPAPPPEESQLQEETLMPTVSTKGNENWDFQLKS